MGAPLRLAAFGALAWANIEGILDKSSRLGEDTNTVSHCIRSGQVGYEERDSNVEEKMISNHVHVTKPVSLFLILVIVQNWKLTYQRTPSKLSNLTTVLVKSCYIIGSSLMLRLFLRKDVSTMYTVLSIALNFSETR